MVENTIVMPRKRDRESGRFTDAYDDEDFLDAIRAAGGLAGTADVAEHVGCTRRHALNRLHELEEDGTVTSREIGSSIAWEIADE